MLDVEPYSLSRIAEPTPLVSVITIAYNHERFIARALESFIAQETNFAFEVIVVIVIIYFSFPDSKHVAFQTLCSKRIIKKEVNINFTLQLSLINK